MFLERLLSLCSENGTDISNVLRSLGLSTSKGTAWRNGSIPNGDILLKLANYFHVSTDYLLGNTDDPKPAGQEKAPSQQGGRELSDKDIMFALWGDTDEVDETDLEDVRRYAAFVKERKKQK